GMEAEGSGIAVLEQAFAFVVHTEGVGGVVDDFQVVLLGDGTDGFYIAGVSEYVHGNNSPGLRRNFRLDVLRRQAPGFRINVCKHWLYPLPLQRARGGDEGERGCNRLRRLSIDRLVDTQGTIGYLQCQGAV